MADRLSPSYRVLTTDLLTNRILSEIPFTGIDYETSLSNAGSFSGSVFVDSESKKLDLYNSTMPGKTGLYVLRNNVCVWGGMVWSREYDLESRSLSVSASEFTSYLYHRIIWKTFQPGFSGTLTVTGDVNANAIVEIPNGAPFNVSENDSIRLTFAPPSTGLNGYFLVKKSSTRDTIIIDPSSRTYRATKRKTIAVNKNKGRVDVRIKTQSAHGLKPSEVVVLTNTGVGKLNGSFTVRATPSTTTFDIRVPGGHTKKALKTVQTSYVNLSPLASVSKPGALPVGTYSVGVYIKTNVFDYISGLIRYMSNDFTGIEFPNVQIEAGQTFGYDVSSVESSGGVVTMQTDAPHEMAVGQKITVKNVSKEVDGEFYVLEILDANTFTYKCPSNFLSYREVSPTTKAITLRTTAKGLTTYTTSTSHGFYQGQTVEITNAPSINRTVGTTSRTDVYDGTYTINNISSNVKFSHSTGIPADDTANYATMAKNPGVVATSYPTVEVGTYGPYPQYADIGFDFDESDRELFGGLDIATEGVRGYTLTTVGEYLEEFANSTASPFDFRVECRYDEATNSFSRIFRFVPVISGYSDDDFADALSYGGYDNVVFEYPGNISSFSISESAEDSMTRMFVVGNKEGLSEDASQPYSSAPSPELTNGWPLLDASESAKDIESEDLLAVQAERYVQESVPPIIDFSIDINGSLDPVVGSYTVGQWCSIIVDDEFVKMRLASDYEPRKDVLLRRIMGIKVSVPESSTFPEKVSLNLVPELEVNGFAE
jgi:hypothetical protein